MGDAGRAAARFAAGVGARAERGERRPLAAVVFPGRRFGMH